MATQPETPEKLTLDRTDGSATIALYRAALGPVRPDHYLKTFTRFDAAGRSSPSWNWAAALLSFNWMLYRKLWTVALAYVGALVAATLLLFGIGRLVFALTEDTQWLLLLAVVLLSIAVPGVYGNAWLYAHCNRKMERALIGSATVDEACTRLSHEASGIKRMVSLAGLNVSLGLLIAAIALSWPQAGALPQATAPVARTQAEGLVQNNPAMSAGTASAPQTASVEKPRASNPVQPQASAPVQPQASPTSQTEIDTATDKTSKPAQAEPRATAQADAAHKASPAADAAKATKAAKAAKAAAAAKEEKAAKAEKAATKAAEISLAGPATATVRGAPEPGKFLINVGLFADDNNARNALVKLQDAGLPALSQEVTSSKGKGKRTRVRVGPFETQAEADRAAERIRALKLDAVVFKT
jgi:hypothetical protein